MLLNAKKTPRRPSDFDEAKYGISWKELLNLIRVRHAPIEQFLGTGRGVFLQGVDAEIAHNIVLGFARRGYPCLPVHDSFVVHHELEDLLDDLMRAETKKRVGVALSSKKKSDYLVTYLPVPTTNLDTANMHSSAISEAFGQHSDYAGYHQRQTDWLTGR